MASLTRYVAYYCLTAKIHYTSFPVHVATSKSVTIWRGQKGKLRGNVCNGFWA